MSSYRFCRTDDVGLLVDALNRCWSPHFPDEAPMTPAAFKRSIRDLQVWCSSCMVAFTGPDPIAVLIGAKRPSGTLIHKIAVHPDHGRQGHGRHLLTSLGSKLAILGPPRMVAEVPEGFGEASGLFSVSGYVQEAPLTDYVWERDENDAGQIGALARSSDERSGTQGPPRARSRGVGRSPTLEEGRFVIPVTIDDLAANGLLGDDHPQVCWERSVETLTARKDDIAGLAVASDERIEAYLLYVNRGVDPPAFAPSGERELRRDVAGALAEAGGTEIMSLRSFVEDGGTRLTQLLSRLGMGTFRFPRVHPAEISEELLETLGFRPVGGHLLYGARARSE